ncbi:MAG: oligosaccharide repeat unit polymerase [Candidatus Omnitrophica bacterium]|nr:oligosaccharide repeat unit polymerase [Candidatus Omnitrophota bacterium]
MDNLLEYSMVVFLYAGLISYLVFALFYMRRYFLSFDIIMTCVMLVGFLFVFENLGSEKNLSILLLYILFAASFLIAYNIRSLAQQNNISVSNNGQYNYKFLGRVSLAVLCFAALLWSFYIFKIGGLYSLLAVSKMGRSVLTRELSIGYLTVSESFILITYTIFLVLAFEKRKPFYYLVVTVTFALLGFLAFVNISRGQLVALFIIPTVIWAAYSKKRITAIIIFVCISLAILGIGFKESMADLHKKAVGGYAVLELSAYQNHLTIERIAHPYSQQYYILKDILAYYDLFPSSEKYGLGLLKSAFIRTIPFIDAPSISTLYVQTFFPQTYEKGGGRGFSLLGEFFLNFNIFGVVLLGFFLGKITRWLYIKSFYAKDPLYIAIYSFVYPSAFGLLQASSTTIMNSLILYKVLPLLLVFGLAKRKFINIHIKKYPLEIIHETV